MRVLLIDIDTLRADRMGCYGYKRNTTPTIDGIAEEGVVFDNYYCPNAPCLPSRASLITGQYGIRTGIVGHGGTAADLRLQGASRGFDDDYSRNNLFMQFRKAGMHTVSVSSFPERHSSWWFNAGLMEWYNGGNMGNETGEVITDLAVDWLRRNGQRDNWMLHVHLWDPHTPYRTTDGFGNPFSGVPNPDPWITEEVFERHKRQIGPHGLNELNMWDDKRSTAYPKQPGRADTLSELNELLDLYDCGVRFADDCVGRIIGTLKEMNIYDDDTAVIVTSDHGENMGELGIYSEHATADYPTCRIPMIIKWKGAKKGARKQKLHDNVDLLPTVRQLLGVRDNTPYIFDGVSFSDDLTSDSDTGKDSLVLTQCAHVCQRSAVFDDYLYIKTYHGGGYLFDEEMLFNIKTDPHQTENLAKTNPQLCQRGASIIQSWTDAQMKKSRYQTDPLWTVLAEGGPLHARGKLQGYYRRLKETGRAEGAEALLEKYPSEIKPL